jgi:hypothetical protein
MVFVIEHLCDTVNHFSALLSSSGFNPPKQLDLLAEAAELVRAHKEQKIAKTLPLDESRSEWKTWIAAQSSGQFKTTISSRPSLSSGRSLGSHEPILLPSMVVAPVLEIRSPIRESHSFPSPLVVDFSPLPEVESPFSGNPMPIGDLGFEPLHQEEPTHRSPRNDERPISLVSPIARSDIVEDGDPQDRQEIDASHADVSPLHSPGFDEYDHGRTRLVNVVPPNDDDRARIVFLPLLRRFGTAVGDTSAAQNEIRARNAPVFLPTSRFYDKKDFRFCQDTLARLAYDNLMAVQRTLDYREHAECQRNEELGREAYHIWHSLHLHRWADRDDFEGHASFGRRPNESVPRLYVPWAVVEQLRVAYIKDNGTIGFVFPFASGSKPIRSFPIAFDPCVRIQLSPNDAQRYHCEWITPTMDHPKVARVIGYDSQDPSFRDFAQLQGQTKGWHPLKRAVLWQLESFGIVQFCLFKFLHHFYLDVPMGDGVLFRDDARLLWSQTSEFVRVPTRAEAAGRKNNFRTPTLVLRIQGLHYAWWRSGNWGGSDVNATGTARLYCIEADREIYFAPGKHYSLYGYDV